MGLAPGMCTPLFLAAPLARRLVYSDTPKKASPEELHRALLRRVNHTGSDVRVCSGFITNPKAFPRQSAAADWGLWRKGFSYRWKSKEHINALELRSLIHSMEYRVHHFREVGCRVFHLTDSYVVMSIVAKGRSSSNLLKPLLRRLSALVLSYWSLCGGNSRWKYWEPHRWGQQSVTTGLGKRALLTGVPLVRTLSLRTLASPKLPCRDISPQFHEWLTYWARLLQNAPLMTWWQTGYSKNSKTVLHYTW